MSKVQTQGKVGKVGDTFGLIGFFTEQVKMAKMKYKFFNNEQSSNPGQS